VELSDTANGVIFLGVVLDAHKRIQVNVPLKKSEVIGFEKVQEVRLMHIKISNKEKLNMASIQSCPMRTL
jgi:hypothetical protein